MSVNKLNVNKQEYPEFQKLLQQYFVSMPKVGDTVRGKILSIDSAEIRVDINGVAVGVVRGFELEAAEKDAAELKVGDEVEVIVLLLENENGEMELALKSVGSMRAWDKLLKLAKDKTQVAIRINDANKGGLMATLEGVTGFLPVSQLSPDHYPRVQGGDKGKILEKLKEFVDTEITVVVYDVSEKENKLIFSEKAIWETEQKDILGQLKLGDIIEGEIAALADFGAFVRFGDGFEGLIHISELAWQRIDHPKDVVSVGDTIKAQIIQIDGSKIFLSTKRLVEDPWRHVSEKYKIGQIVRGRVLKTNPFGLFVELDPEIHGLAHVTELADEPPSDAITFCNIGDEFDFEVVNIEPGAHRLGLRIAGVKPKQKTKPDKLEMKNE
jgi:ribosomal protein S1